jgi:hypothetical protein
MNFHKIAAGSMVFLCATAVSAQSLVCAEDSVTFMNICFHKDQVKSNGDFRTAKMYRGGPNSISSTNFTARVYCPGKTMELTDKSGVAFARNVPATQSGKDFVRFLCEHQKTTYDKNMRTS